MVRAYWEGLWDGFGGEKGRGGSVGSCGGDLWLDGGKVKWSYVSVGVKER